MPILGDSTNYTVMYRMSGNTKVCAYGPLFNLFGKKAYITQMKAKIYNDFGRWFRYGVYKKTDNVAYAILKMFTFTSQVVVYGEIVTINLVSPITLEPGYYTFSIICEGTIGVYGGAQAGHTEHHEVFDAWGDGFSDPFYPPGPPAGITNSNFSRTIYAEYTPVPIKKLPGGIRLGVRHMGR